MHASDFITIDVHACAHVTLLCYKCRDRYCCTSGYLNSVNCYLWSSPDIGIQKKAKDIVSVVTLMDITYIIGNTPKPKPALVHFGHVIYTYST